VKGADRPDVFVGSSTWGSGIATGRALLYFRFPVKIHLGRMPIYLEQRLPSLRVLSNRYVPNDWKVPATTDIATNCAGGTHG
jgi:hypothetical protein